MGTLSAASLRIFAISIGFYQWCLSIVPTDAQPTSMGFSTGMGTHWNRVWNIETCSGFEMLETMT